MFSQSFLDAFDRVIGNEGGFQDDPMDRGNWTGGEIGKGHLKGTKYGISAMTYPDLPLVSMKDLSIDQARIIYRDDFWNTLGLDKVDNTSIGYQLFDAAINHGFRNATKMIQRACGADADGYIGPETICKINETDKNDLLLRFLAERLIFMTHISTWERYGKGWARRIAHNLVYASKDN